MSWHALLSWQLVHWLLHADAPAVRHAAGSRAGGSALCAVCSISLSAAAKEWRHHSCQRMQAGAPGSDCGPHCRLSLPDKWGLLSPSLCAVQTISQHVQRPRAGSAAAASSCRPCATWSCSHTCHSARSAAALTAAGKLNPAAAAAAAGACGKSLAMPGFVLHVSTKEWPCTQALKKLCKMRMCE